MAKNLLEVQTQKCRLRVRNSILKFTEQMFQLDCVIFSKQKKALIFFCKYLSWSIEWVLWWSESGLIWYWWTWQVFGWILGVMYAWSVPYCPSIERTCTEKRRTHRKEEKGKDYFTTVWKSGEYSKYVKETL